MRRLLRFLAATSLLGSSAALAGCATCMWMCFAPILNEHGGGEVVAFEEVNLSFQYPGHPWVNLLSAKEKAEATAEGTTRIHLMRLDPSVGFILVAEEGNDATYSTARLADVALENMKSAAKDVETGPRTAQRIGGLDGLRFESTAVVDGDPLRYVHWVAARNGFLYQLIVYGPTDEELQPIAGELFSGVRQLDPTRSSSKITVERFTTWEAPALGLSVDLSSERFATWAPDDYLDNVTVGGTRFDTSTFFAISPVLFEGPRPSSDALLHAALSFLDYGVPDPDIQRLGSAEDSGFLVERYAMRKQMEETTWEYRVEVRSSPERALLTLVWGNGGAPEVDDAAARVSAATDFGPSRDGVLLDERQRAVQAGLANSVGVHYWNARQYRDGAVWFERAVRLATDDATYAKNLLATYNRDVRHREAVEAWAAMPEEVREQREIRSWGAWHLKEAGKKDEALAVYQQLFGAEHDDEDDLVGYVGLLVEAGRPEEGMSAYRAFAAKHPSKTLYATLARELSKKDAHASALTVLDEGQQKLGVVPELAFARMGIYESSQRYRDVLAVCDELIAAGYGSAEVYHWQGRARFRLELYRDARASYERVLSLRPEDPHAGEWLAQIASLLGESGDLDLEVPLSPVPVPRELQAELDALEGRTPDDEAFSDYGAYYAYRVHAVDVRDGRMRETYHQRIHITSERGVDDLSTLKWTFEPPEQRIFVNRLEVRDANGKLLKQGEPKDYYVIHNREDGQASARRTLHMPLPRLAPGNTIDVVVTLAQGAREDRVPFRKSYLSTTRPVQLAAFAFTGEVEGLGHKGRHTAPARRIDGGYLWTEKEPPVYRREAMAPPREETSPHVVVGDRRAQWRALAKEYLERIEDRLAVDEDVRRVAERVVGDARSDEEKMRRIWRHVQRNVTYQAIEFGVRGVIPEAAQKTLDQGYGDCKDHAVLLKGLLGAVGIPSQLVLIDTRSPLERDLPSLNQFNHMILYVPGPRGGRFLDATDKEFDLAMRTPTGLGGQEALVLSEAPRVVKLPSQDEGSRARVERTITVDASDGFTIVEELVLDGYFANFMRAALKRVDAADQKQWAQDMVSSELPQANVTQIRVENLLDNDAPLVLTLHYATRAGMISRGDELVLSLPLMWERYYFALRTGDEREKPFFLRYPLSLSSKTKVHASDGLKLTTTTGTKQGQTPSARYTAKVASAKEGVEVELAVQIRAGTYPAAEVARHRDLLDAGLRAAQESVHATVR